MVPCLRELTMTVTCDAVAAACIVLSRAAGQDYGVQTLNFCALEN